MSTEIRLAEDQMQRLLRCILAAGWLVRNDGSQSFQANWRSAEAMLSYEPKPEPAPVCVPHSLSQPHKPSVYGPGDHGYFGEHKPEPKPDPAPIPAMPGEIERLKTQIECLQSNLDAANDRAHMAEGRAYSLMCDYNRCKKEAELEVERLKAQVPKERLKVIIWECGRAEYYVRAKEAGVRISPVISSSGMALRWAEDHGLEVVE